MATIIDCDNGRFIAGDAPASLDLGQHWCTHSALHPRA